MLLLELSTRDTTNVRIQGISDRGLPCRTGLESIHLFAKLDLSMARQSY